MISECDILNEDELALICSQLLLNSKILSLIENKSSEEPIRILKVSDGKIAVLNEKKHSLFFSSETDPESALDIFIYLNSDYAIRIIEGAAELMDKIGLHLNKLGKKYDATNMLLMSKEIGKEISSMSSDFEFVSGKNLIDFGAQALVGKFSSEKLNTSLTDEDSKKLILSSSREFMGLKIEDDIVSVAAWIREVHGYRCLSYVYTDEKFRGKGLGDVLISKLLSDACDKYKGAFLFVDESNFSALKLYKKLEFSNSGHLTQLKLF